VSIEVRKKLKEIIGNQGIGIIEDQKRLENLLRDYCPQNRREVRALIDALKEGVPEEIKAGGKGLDNLLRARLVKRLQDNVGLNDELIRWSIDSWSEALGVKCEVVKKPDAGSKEVPEVSVKSISLNLGKGINLEMVLVPAGKFVMGSPEGEKGRDNDEDQHEVTITKPFYMGKYEVTQHQWEEVMGNSPSYYKGAKLPVHNVSWNECQEFIQKFNSKGKGGYRLPTEAEWEYAARARTTMAYSFGDSITHQEANYRGSKIGKPVPVGSYKANAFGLYDMHGNVWEWCEDKYGEYYKDAITDPRSCDFGVHCVLRGGSFYYDARSARLADRSGNYSPVDRSGNVGFRLARTP